MKIKSIVISLCVIIALCVCVFISKNKENSDNKELPLSNINNSIENINKNDEQKEQDTNNDNKKVNIIEISTKNWNTYFEFADTVKWDYNAFNEVDGMSIRKVIKLKSDYYGKIADNSNIAFEVTGIIRDKILNADYVNKKYTLKSTKSNGLKQTKTASLNLTQNSYEQEASIYWCHDGYYMEGNKKIISIDVIENLNMKRVQGTLYLYD